MAEDVSDALRQDMLATFALKQVMDPKITALQKKIREGKATQNDVAAYSDRLGELVRATMHDVITPEALPNETLYYNILEKTVGVLLKNAHMDVNKKAIEAQKAIDKANGIGMSAVEAPYPQKRVDDLLYKAGKPGTSYEDAMKTLDAPVETLTRAFHDDHIKKNADVRFHAGLSLKIVRTASFKCCEWCASLAGVYNYEDVKNTGNDVWRRHENCKCTVEYVCDGKKTEVWGPKHYEADEETLRARESYHTEVSRASEGTVESRTQIGSTATMADAETIRARTEYRTSTGDTSAETLQLRSEYGVETRRVSPEEMQAEYDQLKEKKAAANLDSKVKGDIIDEGYDPADIRKAITQQSTNFVIRDIQHPDSLYGELCENIPPLEGYYDLKMHGSPERVKIFYSAVDAQELARIISFRDDYNGGPIRLLSCETGKIVDGTCIGMEVSKLLGEDVLAPTEVLIVSSSGSITIKSEEGVKGWMRLFHPDGSYEEDF